MLITPDVQSFFGISVETQLIIWSKENSNHQHLMGECLMEQQHHTIGNINRQNPTLFSRIFLFIFLFLFSSTFITNIFILFRLSSFLFKYCLTSCRPPQSLVCMCVCVCALVSETLSFYEMIFLVIKQANVKTLSGQNMI